MIAGDLTLFRDPTSALHAVTKQYVDALVAGGTGPTGPAGGDLTGTYPNPTLVAILTAGGPTGSSTVIPVITWDAKGRLTAVSSAAVNVSGRLLDASRNTDTVAHTPVRGDLIVANSTPFWSSLAIGVSGQYLRSNGSDPSWQTIVLSDIPNMALRNIGWGQFNTPGATTFT